MTKIPAVVRCSLQGGTGLDGVNNIMSLIIIIILRIETSLDGVDNSSAIAAGVCSSQNEQGGGEEKCLNFENMQKV